MNIDRRVWLGATIIVVLLLAVVGVIFLQKPKEDVPEPTTFYECSQRYPVEESFPRRCKVPLGKTFVEYVGNELEKKEFIRVNEPGPAPVLSNSPISVRGEVHMSWYSTEGFLIEIVDEGGRVIGQGYAEVVEEEPETEQTGDFSPFVANIEFEHPNVVSQGALVFHKANTTAGEASVDHMVIPVVF